MSAPKKRKRPRRARLDEHSLFSLLRDRYAPLMQRHFEAQQRKEVLKLASPDYETYVTMNSLLQLATHAGKLDQCVYHLRSAGKTGYYVRARQHITRSDWQEYHLGYFYTLHRSVYESALWFVNQSLQLGLAPKTGFVAKILPLLKDMSDLTTALGDLRKRCEKAAAHRNDHIHRGAGIKAKPLTDLAFIDETRFFFAADQLIHRLNSSKVPADIRAEIAKQFGLSRKLLIYFLNEEIDQTQNLLCKIADQIEPVYRELYASTDPKTPAAG
jgi:hypothetical protein